MKQMIPPLNFFITPFFSLKIRLKRFEGALWAVALSLLLVSNLTIGHILVKAIYALLVLSLLYAFNDLYDAAEDLEDPGKDKLYATFLLKRKKELYAYFLLLKGFLLLWTQFSGQIMEMSLLLCLFLVNIIYSVKLKRIPVLDVLTCAIWGGLYIFTVIPKISFILISLVALMTGVCHLGQVFRDHFADSKNRILTSAVFSKNISLLSW